LSGGGGAFMDNVVLVGMPGAGKSTVGVLLAKALGMDFADTDLEIQRRHGKLLQDMIDELGIAGFLKAEEETILGGKYFNAIIATGGSAVYSEKAMAHLKERGVVVYLEAGLDTIRKRIGNISTRGIAMGRDQALEDIYLERIPLYEKYADITVNCEGRDAEGVVGSIIEKLDRFNK